MLYSWLSWDHKYNCKENILIIQLNFHSLKFPWHQCSLGHHFGVESVSPIIDRGRLGYIQLLAVFPCCPHFSIFICELLLEVMKMHVKYVF